jgi:hypothetical protein
MKAQLTYNWIKDTDFNAENPLTCRIDNVIQEGKETILQFTVTSSQEKRQMSLWGNNWNCFVKKFPEGTDTDEWETTQFRLLQTTNAADGKKKRIVEV